MAQREMFNYNQKKGEYPREADKKDNGWEASVENKLFVVTNKDLDKKYIVDGFKDKVGCEFDEKDEKDIWYSFDSNTYNFHIVPDKTVKKTGCIDEEKNGEKTIYDWLSAKLGYISAEVNKILGKVSTDSGGNKLCTCNHKYVSVDIGENEYLMSFNRLWCDVRTDGNHICSSFGQAQFMCYPITDKHINQFRSRISPKKINVEFKMMYPHSGEDDEGRFDHEFTHLVYNAPYSMSSGEEEIAKGFAKFIELCEAKRILYSIAKFTSWVGE